MILTYGKENIPSRRFRMEAFFPFFKQAGLNIKLFGIEDGWLQKTNALLRLPQAKTCIIQKKLFRKSEIRIIRSKCEKLIFDFDDAIFLSPKGKKRFKQVVQAADLVFAGNAFLVESAKAFNNKTILVRTGLSLEDYQPKPELIIPDNPTIGWVGTFYNLKKLAELAPGLNTVKEKLNCNFIYIADKPHSELNKAGWDFLQWTANDEIENIKKLTIGLMPLPDDIKSRGKCGFKAIQYMALGIPALASDVGFNSELITHQKNGLLIKEDKDWPLFLENLLTDQSLFNLLSNNGRERALDFDVKKIFSIIIKHL